MTLRVTSLVVDNRVQDNQTQNLVTITPGVLVLAPGEDYFTDVLLQASQTGAYRCLIQVCVGFVEFRYSLLVSF